MKNYVLPLALVSLFALQACNEKQPAAQGEVAVAAPASLALETSEQRLSYGIAYGLGKRLAADGVPVQTSAFAAGIEDALAGTEPRLTQEEIAAEMKTYQAEAMAKQKEVQAAQAAASVAFMEANATREGVVVTESGLQYEILEAGDGPQPGLKDTVEVNYRGTLTDGTQFDSSYDRGQTVKFGVNQVIPGWTEALQLMPVGSKWKLAIPSDLAYGTGGAGGGVIGPNAALIFEVELVSIPSQEEAAKPEAAEPEAKPEAEAG